MSSRIEKWAAQKKADNKTSFIPYIMAGDPDYDRSLQLLMTLPSLGADIIELGMPFSDPMADGPVIQQASIRSLEAGTTPARIFKMVAAFRKIHPNTPIILMGYYNIVHHYGIVSFVRDAKVAGVDGFIIVDLPPEEDQLFREALDQAELALVRLITPTSDDQRIAHIVSHASGFVYYVSVTGVTGGPAAEDEQIASAIKRIRKHTDLPVAIGFGIKTPQDVKRMKPYADAVVVGSSIVEKMGKNQSSREIQSFIADLASQAN